MRSTTARRAAVAITAAIAATLVAAGPAPAAQALWPSMRHDTRNTGATRVAAHYRGDQPWAFHTGKGIFSTPVIGADGTIYVGSADTRFFALTPSGRVRWQRRTGGIIDAAAAIGPYDPQSRTAPVTFGSGDERLYQVRADTGRLRWTLKAPRPPADTQLVSWWEGNVAPGPDGDLYVGNTGGGAYRITPQGKVRWVDQRTNSVWTTPAFGPEGTTYWGSLDLSAFALGPDGRQRWAAPTLGYVVASPAVGTDGTVYTASFDGHVVARDPATGAARWTFATHDHVYASPALGERGGVTRDVYVASTDGAVYALTPDGRLRWSYDTGDPIRSSPVVGRAPGDPGHDVVYVGSSDGRLYALDAATGRRRWSFDTTPADPRLADRNDLNGSPALGRSGVYVGGEHGDLVYVPYDYCLHRRDARCSTAPGAPLAGDLTRALWLSPGGATLPQGPQGSVAAAASFAFRLVRRHDGATQDAGLRPSPSPEDLVSFDPPVPLTAQLSGDGRQLLVRPRGFLKPGTGYRVRIRGPYALNAIGPTGARTPGPVAGQVDSTVTFRTTRAGARRPPLHTGQDRVTGLRIRRLALPLPPFLASVNQIGFDSYEWLAGTLQVTTPDAQDRGRLLLWVTGVRPGPGGGPVADPKAGFAFPIAGRYQGDALVLSRRDLSLRLSFGDIPQRTFELRGRLGADGRMDPGASLSSETDCRTLPTYGPLLIAIGLCNARGILPAAGTFLTAPYPRSGPAARRPPGLRVRRVTLAGGTARATFALAPGRHYRPGGHVVSIVLADAGTLEPVAFDQVKATSVATDPRGDLRSVTVRLPPGTKLPRRVRAYVMADAFPLAALTLR
jgi:outer membrane protein assembly factor BamB